MASTSNSLSARSSCFSCATSSTPTGRGEKSDTLQFLPLLAGILLWLSLYGALVSGRLKLTDAHFSDLVTIYLLLKATYFYTYLFRAASTLRRGLRGEPRFTAERRQVELGWLSSWLLSLGVVAGAIYLSFFLHRFGYLEMDSDTLGSLLLALTIYLVSLLVLLRPWVLSVRRREPGRFAAEAAQLRAYLERERPFLDPELTLAGLAAALGTTENRLSQILNEGLGTSFYDLLNRCRLAYFEDLAEHEDLRERSVLDLAFEAGFNSKASFYRIFRQAHSTTPAAFRKARLS